mmetsp:Transcript_38314/g.87742  ORF Transcript_38314/g.87742 Transcript_38314/m.87742 type:complete len:499 (-) Transcript_38314:579-2075(-)
MTFNVGRPVTREPGRATTALLTAARARALLTCGRPRRKRRTGLCTGIISAMQLWRAVGHMAEQFLDIVILVFALIIAARLLRVLTEGKARAKEHLRRRRHASEEGHSPALVQVLGSRDLLHEVLKKLSGRYLCQLVLLGKDCRRVVLEDGERGEIREQAGFEAFETLLVGEVRHRPFIDAPTIHRVERGRHPRLSPRAPLDCGARQPDPTPVASEAVQHGIGRRVVRLAWRTEDSNRREHPEEVQVGVAVLHQRVVNVQRRVALGLEDVLELLPRLVAECGVAQHARGVDDPADVGRVLGDKFTDGGRIREVARHLLDGHTEPRGVRLDLGPRPLVLSRANLRRARQEEDRERVTVGRLGGLCLQPFAHDQPKRAIPSGDQDRSFLWQQPTELALLIEAACHLPLHITSFHGFVLFVRFVRARRVEKYIVRAEPLLAEDLRGDVELHGRRVLGAVDVMHTRAFRKLQSSGVRAADHVRMRHRADAVELVLERLRGVRT